MSFNFVAVCHHPLGKIYCHKQTLALTRITRGPAFTITTRKLAPIMMLGLELITIIRELDVTIITKEVTPTIIIPNVVDTVITQGLALIYDRGFTIITRGFTLTKITRKLRHTVTTGGLAFTIITRRLMLTYDTRTHGYYDSRTRARKINT